MIYLTHENIENIIDYHIKSEERNLMFVCDANLAYYISNYLSEEYGIEDKHTSLFTNSKEFYLMIRFNDPEIDFYCEKARGDNGKYKSNTLNNCDHFILNNVDMSEKEIDYKLKGEDCTWMRFELISEEENELEDCDGCCECCGENGISYDELLDIYTERLQGLMCPHCIKEILDEFADHIIEALEEELDN